MTEQLIQHVSDTAFWVAHYRVQEGLRRKPLFEDPLAEVLSGERGRAIAKDMGNQKLMQWTLSVRTYVIDMIIKEQIAKGVDTVINLGAGLDTRPYRLDLPRDLLWIEVDFPGVIDFKEQRLQGQTARCRLERIRQDLSQPAGRLQVFQELNARAKKALIVTEGVVPYLSLEEAADLAQDLKKQPHFALWITDYFSSLFLRLRREGRIRTVLPKQAPFRFSPEDWEGFFKTNGWVLEHMYHLGVEGEKIGRPMPMPWFAKPWLLFASEARLQAIRQLTGYGLLKRS